MKKILLLLFFSPVAFAQNNTNNNSAQRELLSPETQRVLQACVDSSRKDHQGYPNRNDMKKCLEAEGYRVPDIVNPKSAQPNPYNGS